MIKRFIASYLFVCLLPALAAATTSSLVLRSDVIKIIKQSPGIEIPEVEEDSDASAADDSPIKPAYEAVSFTVQLRSEEVYRLQGVQALSRLKEDTGVMVVFRAPIDMPLMQLSVYTPVDVLMVDDGGRVVQIVPEIVLGRLTSEVRAGEPLKALIYLHAGAAVANGIRPGDRVEHPYFTPPPTVIK